MYDELIQRLENEAEFERYLFPHSDNETAAVLHEAADAIEDLEFACNRYEKDYKALCEYLPKWIPCSERLPEPHEEVLVCNEEYGLSELGFAMAAVWDGADWIETWNKREEIHCVTHWMPLPQPPEKSES